MKYITLGHISNLIEWFLLLALLATPLMALIFLSLSIWR
jgi:hypothetical protein